VRKRKNEVNSMLIKQYLLMSARLDALEAKFETVCDHLSARLDALEAKFETVCDHYGSDKPKDYYGTSTPPQENDWNFRFCPNCGVKL